jgi:Tfp pilus assembly protein FimT
MIDLVVMAISAILCALLLVWWRSPAFRSWIEAPKCFMLHQERRFDDQLKGTRTVAITLAAWPRDSHSHAYSHLGS